MALLEPSHRRIGLPQVREAVAVLERFERFQDYAEGLGLINRIVTSQHVTGRELYIAKGVAFVGLASTGQAPAELKEYIGYLKFKLQDQPTEKHMKILQRDREAANTFLEENPQSVFLLGPTPDPYCALSHVEVAAENYDTLDGREDAKAAYLLAYSGTIGRTALSSEVVFNTDVLPEWEELSMAAEERLEFHA